MGYYTDYDFSNNSEEVIEAINDVSGYSEYDDGHYYGIKWYNHEKDMKEVSKRFPDQVLVLSGHGEESGDIWKAYYKNGKSQRANAKIVFEPFDESKLK